MLNFHLKYLPFSYICNFWKESAHYRKFILNVMRRKEKTFKILKVASLKYFGRGGGGGDLDESDCSELSTTG